MQPIYFCSIQLTAWPAEVSETPIQCYREAAMCRGPSAIILVQWWRRRTMELSNNTLHWVGNGDWTSSFVPEQKAQNLAVNIFHHVIWNAENMYVLMPMCYACCCTKTTQSGIHKLKLMFYILLIQLLSFYTVLINIKTHDIRTLIQLILYQYAISVINFMSSTWHSYHISWNCYLQHTSMMQSKCFRTFVFIILQWLGTYSVDFIASLTKFRKQSICNMWFEMSECHIASLQWNWWNPDSGICGLDSHDWAALLGPVFPSLSIRNEASGMSHLGEAKHWPVKYHISGNMLKPLWTF